MIDVIDYGGGNLGSMLRCLDRLEVPYQRVSGQQLPSGKNPLLFPGVGSFGAAMQNLQESGLKARLQQLIKEGTPYLGICIGLQVLFDGSEEAPGVSGLGLIPGQVVQFKQGKVPQIGWNWIESSKSDWDAGHVYFVNSFYPKPDDPNCALYQADYYGPFTAAVQQDHMTAFQFHPEKSGPFGQTLIRRWCDAVNRN